MKSVTLSAFFALALFCFWGLPSDSHGFSITASDFSGYCAYDAAGDAIGTFQIDSPLGYENTGRYFNAAAGLQFNFEYQPLYPSVEDIMAAPNANWLWTFTFSDFTLPCANGYLPDLKYSHTASYNDILAGVSWAQTIFEEQFPDGFACQFDYGFLTPNTGYGKLAMAANINQMYLPPDFPEKYWSTFDSQGKINITASPVPEPITFVLFGAGLAGIKLVRKFKGKGPGTDRI